MVKTVVLFNPSIGSQNVGDSIISKSIKKIVNDKFQNYMICEMPTQMPVSKKVSKRFQNADVKLVMGTNLLQSHMGFRVGRRGIYTHAIRQWDTSFINRKLISGSILFGCGWQDYDENVDWFTKNYWVNVLNHDLIHSVRDEFTLRMLNKIGVNNVLNTGCPTTWGLTHAHCDLISKSKAKNVVATITDYRADKHRDTLLLNTLLANYQNVYLWLQGQGDLAYFNTFDDSIRNSIQLVPPNLSAYSKLLDSQPIDYVGTRLHGGIFALQHKARSIIIGIDNRALEMIDTGLCVLPQNEINGLSNLINSKIEFNIKLHEDNIQMFLSQFYE